MERPVDGPVEILKRDALGRVERVWRDGAWCVRRVTCGGGIPGSRLLARLLARRERRALARLAGIEGVPSLRADPRDPYLREFVAGARLDRGGRPGDAYFDRLLGLLAELHARGVAHNDLAKEANVLIRDDGTPGLVDFQLAVVLPPPRSRAGERLFELLRREDLRHVLKHKALRRPDLLTEGERGRIERRSFPARAWRRCVKPVYNFVTRRILRTADREGEGLRPRVRTAGR